MQTSLFLAFLTALMLHVVGLAVMSFGWQAWRESWPRPEPLATATDCRDARARANASPPPESPPEPVSYLMSTRFPSLCPLPRPCQRLSRYPRRCSRPPKAGGASSETCASRADTTSQAAASARTRPASCTSRSAKLRPVQPARSPQRTPGERWQWLAGHPQPQPRQSRKHLSLLPLPRERALGHCLPMAICQWRQALVAVGRGTGSGRARAGTGEGAGGGTGPGRGGGSGHGTGSGSGTSARPMGGYQVKPRYPESARRRGIEGTVLLKMRITAQGRVEDVQVVRSAGYPELDESAMEAVRRWRFEPARRNGAPVAEDAVLLPVVFQLQ